MALVNQPTKSPSRKMWAVILSGAIAGAIQGGLNAAFPSADFTLIVREFSPYITAGIMTCAGYMTRDRA